MRQHHPLATLAAEQHGVVSHRQLLALGYSSAAIGRARNSGRLHPIFRGVYAVGHPPSTQEAVCMAAVLTCGSGALLSHDSAAWLWGLNRTFWVTPHVTVPSRGHCRGAMCIHHSTILAEDDEAEVNGIPVTSVPRTVLDLAAGVSRQRVEGLLDRAERTELLRLGEFESLLARSGRHRGRNNLFAALSIYRDDGFFRARSERLFLALVKKAGLPRPAFNTFVAGHEIDAYWEANKFAVEVDGWDSHRSRLAFETDPIRQEDLMLAGIASIRVTARRIERNPSEVGQRIARLLAVRRRPT